MSTPNDLTKTEALRRIAAITNADDPESYRNDDPHGALDTAHAIAVEALREDKTIKLLVDALTGIIEIGRKDHSSEKYDGYYDDAMAALAKATGEPK